MLSTAVPGETALTDIYFVLVLTPDRDEKTASGLEEALALWGAGPLNSQLQCKVARALDRFA